MLCRLLIVIVSSGIRLKTSRTRKNLIRMLMMVPKPCSRVDAAGRTLLRSESIAEATGPVGQDMRPMPKGYPTGYAGLVATPICLASFHNSRYFANASRAGNAFLFYAGRVDGGWAGLIVPANLVAAAGFGDVEGFVGQADQVFGGGVVIRDAAGHAEAHCGLEGCFATFDGIRRNRFTQVFSQDNRIRPMVWPAAE
jgi:hypothetical protein